MNRYFLLAFLYIILGIFDVNASSQGLSITERVRISSLCVQSLTNDDPRDGLSFEESVSIPDVEYKRRIFRFLGIDKSKVDNILQIGIIRDTQKQDKMLRNVVGLDDNTISFLRDRRVLDVHPIEYLNFMSLPPVNRTHIRSGAIISRANANGYLENVVITKVEGDNVHVRLRGSAREAVISKNEAYQPILVGKQIYYSDFIGIPIRTRITSIGENGQIVIEYPPSESGVKIVHANQLRLRPRREMLTGKEDISRPITRRVLNHIQRDIFRIEELYRSLGEESISLINRNIIHNNLTQLNNELMKKLSAEMRKQGIVTRLVLEPVNIINRRIYLLSLVIDGVHESGNKVMLSHWKKAEIFNVSRIKISLYSSIVRKGFTHLVTNEIELDMQTALDILEKKEVSKDGSVNIRHELTHAKWALRAYINRPSIHHTQFRAIPGRSEIGITHQSLDDVVSSPYNQNLNYQEIYAYISNLIFFSKDPVNHIEDMERTVNIIEILNESVQSFVDDLLQDFDINHSIEHLNYHYLSDPKSPIRNEKGLNPFIDYWQEDSYGRIIGIKLPEEVKQTLRYLITSLSLLEMKELIEGVRKSSDRIPEGYVEFLRQYPIAEEIFDYGRANPEGFLESIETRVLNMKREEASRTLNQEFERQLEQIRGISSRISEQLAQTKPIFERMKDVEDHHDEDFVRAKNELLSVIRNLRLIIRREI